MLFMKLPALLEVGKLNSSYFGVSSEYSSVVYPPLVDIVSVI